MTCQDRQGRPSKSIRNSQSTCIMKHFFAYAISIRFQSLGRGESCVINIRQLANRLVCQKKNITETVLIALMSRTRGTVQLTCSLNNVNITG